MSLCCSFWLSSSIPKSPASTLHLSGSLDTVLCNLIALASSLALFYLTTRTLPAVSSFLSDRACSFGYQPFLPFDQYSDNLEVNIVLKNFFLDNYAPICFSSTDSRTDFFPSVFPPEISILGDFNCHHLLRDLKDTLDPCGKKYWTTYLLSALPLTSPLFFYVSL